MVFSLPALCWRRVRGLWKLSDGRHWLTEGELDLILMGRVMLSKSLIQFSIEGQGCVPSLFFELRPNYGGGNEDNGDLLQKVPSRHCYTQWPQPHSRPPPTTPLPETPGPSWASLGQSLVESPLSRSGEYGIWFQTWFSPSTILLWKCCTQYASKFWKLSSGHRTGKGQF